ncbi:hypothetical protein QR680_007628 [Steinernema hermaphroditum]|uniref:Uncharacterized protein n=1 Tax=Steinernema hermaphroditum TaxID=289476 RepID=A0AA39IFC0_9BILA|nr:hypothetical protein QR680_007628 [Steinernema hermaphroditum]
MFKAVACAIGGIPLHEWNFLLGDLLISGEHPVINGSPLLQNEFWSTLTRLALRIPTCSKQSSTSAPGKEELCLRKLNLPYRSKRHLHHRRQVILPVDFRPLKDMLLSAAVHMALRKVLQDLENEL